MASNRIGRINGEIQQELSALLQSFSYLCSQIEQAT